MKGRRRDPDISPDAYEPGDYGFRNGWWWVCLPTGILGRLDDGWTAEQHDDGTVTIRPSIHDAPLGWHGYLTRGEWVSV